MNILHLIWMALLATLVAACGEGGTGGTGFTGKPVVTIGVISDLNADTLSVNNTAYLLGDVSISFNGKGGVATDLARGMIAKIDAVTTDQNTLQARQITMEDTLSGTVTNVAIDGKGFTLLNQTVKITRDTQYAASFTNIAVGSRVSIMGHVIADGQVIATYISPVSKDAPLAATGYVTNLNLGQGTFNLGKLHVQYDSHLASPELENGAFFKVVGKPSETSGVLDATRMMALKLDLGNHTGSVELEGVVTQNNAIVGEFILLGQPVRIAIGATITGGAVADIQPGRIVHVFGNIQNGVLIAQRVQIEPAEDNSVVVQLRSISIIDSFITHIDPAAKTLKVSGLDTSLFYYDDQTRQPANAPALSADLLDHSIQMRVEKVADRFYISNMALGAVTSRTRNIALLAPVTAIDSDKHTISLLGSTIDIGGAKVASDGNIMDFLAKLTLSQYIDLQYQLQGSSRLEMEISLQNGAI